MKKLIKKYQAGGSTRQYNYQPLPPKDKWNGITSIKDLEGNELSPGDLVMATPEGKMVTPDNAQAYLDYLAANNIPIQGPTLNQITVTHNNQTGKTTTSLGEDFEDRLKRLQQDPIANDSQLKQLWLEQGEQLWNQSHDKHVIDTRAADKAANTRTPEALSIMSPALLGIAAILGFESASAMAAWAATYPEAFTGIVGSTLGGEIINLATNLGSGGKYKDWGDAANQIWGTGETLGGFTNPGYFVNPLSKGISAIEQNGKRLLDQTLTQLNGPWAQRALNAANKYNLGEGVKAGIYNTNYATPFVLNTLSKTIDGIKDVGWVLKKLPKEQYFYDTAMPYRQKYVMPSQRQKHNQLFKIWKSAYDYSAQPRLAKFNGIVNAHSKIWHRNSILATPVKIPLKIIGNQNINSTQVKFLPPYNKVRDWFKSAVWPTFSNEENSGLVSLIDNGKFDKEIFTTFNPQQTFEFTTGLKDISFQPQDLSPEVKEINNLLGDLGHVTGSSITVQDPYTAHIPNDIDIITTVFNYPEVLKRLGAEELNFRGYHAKINSPKYGRMDVQLIHPGFNNTNSSSGKIAQEIYAKLNPEDFAKRITSGEYEVPISPNDLLQAHRNNVLKFSNIDMMLSGQPKHQQRLSGIYAMSDPSYAKEFIKNYEDTYRAYLGDQFQTLEDQGVHINFSDVTNNIEFLKKFGLAESDIEQIANSPEKMKTFVHSFLYRPHFGVRTITVTPGMTEEDILKAALTNGSVSNKGGNFAQRPFGGSSRPQDYGKDNPYLVIVQFPIKNPKTLKTPMDVYNYVGKLIDVAEPIRGDAPVTQTFRNNILADFVPTQEHIDRLRTILHLPESQEYTNVGDILKYTVPNRNPNINVNMDWHSGYIPEEAQKLYQINDQVASLLGDHFWSLQQGFDYGFIAKYAKEIPNLRYKIIPSVNKGFDMGFQLPQLPLKFGIGKQVSARDIFPFIKYSDIIDRLNKNIVNKQTKADIVASNAKFQSDAMINNNVELINNLRSRIKNVAKFALPPLGIYEGIREYNNIRDWHYLTEEASEIFGELPDDLNEALADLKSKYNIILDNEDVEKLKNQAKKNKGTYSYNDFHHAIYKQLKNKKARRINIVK